MSKSEFVERVRANMAKAKRRQGRKSVVKGPQLASRVLLGKSLGKAKGEPVRTARVRYLESPTKKEGNPFFAVRVPRELHAAFLKWCKGKDKHPNTVIRGYMAKVTGVAADEGDDGE